MTKEDRSGEEPGRFSTPKRRDLFLTEYLANTNEERQDVIFRRVRGILNKITPETFDKLSKDLVNVGLDSPRTLRGLIYLLFDKALKDLKYSSLYAKLCQKLSEKSPNFEKEPGPNTFCKFLISKCEDEFERRRKATEDFECKKELTDEEFEQKVIAKQKMLGNIKFICELGKKRLLQEEILHECIRGLLSRKKERPLQDQAQDLECLCQIMRTIGSLLDIETSKNLMNQYFERIDMYSRKQELPSRIRFMLRDVIDLRNNNWRPRPFQREDNVPQPLSKLREEAGFNNAASNSPIDKLGNTKNLMNINNLSRLNASKLSALMIDDDEPGFTTTTDFHWGSTAFLPHENEFDIFSSNTYPQSALANTTPIVNSIKPPNNAPDPMFNQATVSANSSSRFQGSTTAPSSGPIAPRFLQASRYESFVGGGKNHFDTFVHSNQLNDRKSYEREPALNVNDIMPSKRNDNLSDRHNITGGRVNDKRYLKRDNPLSTQSQTPFAKPFPAPTMSAKAFENDPNAAISQQPARDEYIRCNNLARNTAPQHLNNNQQQHRYPSKNADPIEDVRLAKPYIDSPRPLPLNRTNDNSFNSRNTFLLKSQQASEMPPPPPPTIPTKVPPSLPLPAQSRNNQSDQYQDHADFNQSAHRQNQGFPQNGNCKSRRFDRNSRHEHEQRQPKFSGANYRLPGRERPVPQIVGRNQQPESELNLNWRSADAASPKQIGAVTNTTESQPAPQKPTVRQKQADVFDASTKQAVENRQQIFPGDNVNRLDMNKTDNIESNESDFERNLPNQSHQANVLGKSRVSNQNDLMHDSHRRRTPSPHQSQRVVPADLKNQRNFPPPRFSNNFSYGRPMEHNNLESNQLNAPRHRRLNTDSAETRSNFNEQHNASSQILRNGFNDRFGGIDKRDTRDNDESYRLPQPVTQNLNTRHENEHKQALSRPNESSHAGYDRKVARPPALGRNQSFEGNSSHDFKRSPSWRNENTGQSNNLPKKDVLPVPSPIVSVHHQVLSRPPMRMSETDFSLRPSHNLVGRASHESAAKPVERVVDVVHDKAGPATQQEVKQAHSSVLDSQVRQIFGVKKLNDAQPSSESKDRTADTMDQNIVKFMTILKEYLSDNTSDPFKISSRSKDLKLAKELHEGCLVVAMKHVIVKTEVDREKTSKLFSILIPSVMETTALISAFKTIFEQMKLLEVETPKIKSLVAGFLSRAVVDNLLSIEEVARTLAGGKHHPLFLLFLQKLEKSAGQAWLSEKFACSKINLMEMLPEVERTKDRLAVALKDRCLGFLDPMLTIEPDLWAQMRDVDPSPAAVYRWIKDNVDQTIQNTPTFAHVFISCLLKYIHSATTERFNNNNNNVSGNQQSKDPDSSDSNKSSPTNSSQGINDHEKEMLSKYQQMMHAILRDKQMQLATLYALQSFYYNLNFPRGALLRWFHMLYDLSIVDDDVFFIWKEEINDKVPGKGQALFQVNTWLNWLAEPDSEDEEE